jgi:hypothetical protein
MRKAATLALALVAVALVSSPATAAAEPTLMLTKDCSLYPPYHGVTPNLSGFPPNTSFSGTLEFPSGGSVGSPSLSTDAAGNFSIGSFTDSEAGVWTATVVWSGGTLVQSLFVNCALPADKDECKDDGWRNFGTTFKNQGDCVSFVATGGKNQPTG